MRINWRIYWKENLEWKNKEFPKMKVKKLFNFIHCIRLFFRIKFSKQWRQDILRHMPHWVKKHEALKGEKK